MIKWEESVDLHIERRANHTQQVLIQLRWKKKKKKEDTIWVIYTRRSMCPLKEKIFRKWIKPAVTDQWSWVYGVRGDKGSRARPRALTRASCGAV